MQDSNERPSIVGLLLPLLSEHPPEEQPVLTALAERVAAGRYRLWAETVDDADAAQRLSACAEREEEIARRIEALVPRAASIQEAFGEQHPDLALRYAQVFEGATLPEQFAMQAAAERAGAAAWRAFAAAEDDAEKARVLASCALLEEESAETLDALIAGGKLG